MSGWIKVHRKLLRSDVSDDLDLLGLWIWCLLKANHTPRRWRGRDIKAGEFVTSRDQAARELKIKPTTFRHKLKQLESYGYLKLNVDSKCTIVSVCNWSTYQGSEDDPLTAHRQHVDSVSARTLRDGRQHIDRTLTAKQSPNSVPHDGLQPDNGKALTANRQDIDSTLTAHRQQVDTTKETRNKKQELCIHSPPSVDEVAAYCEERSNGIDPQEFVDYYAAVGWTIGRNKPMKDWRAAVRTWERRAKQAGTPRNDTGPAFKVED